MSEIVSFVIRDGLERDISACLKLDHHYETDTVWQMQVSDETGRRIDFKPERLPRTLEAIYPASEAHLRAVLAPEHCFLVATLREDEADSPAVLGYLVMRSDSLYGIGQIHDVVVSRQYRRRQIATRLSRIAARWAKEHHLTRLLIETQTTNYPGIKFCEAAGFTFCGFNDRYFPNRDIAVFFSQSIR